MSLTVEAALQRLGKKQRQKGRRNSRTHQDSMAQNTARISALNGLCGRCVNLKIHKGRAWVDRDKSVALVCTKRHSPLTLYMDYFPGQAQPTCDDFRQK